MIRTSRALLRLSFTGALAGVCWAVVAAGALAEPPKDLDAQIDALMKAGGTPGMAVGIVEHGKLTWSKGYGVKQLGTQNPVDARTLFQIGSTSKAFTSAALALLVDEGKLGWDDKVIDHLPEFQMYDPWVTREITIRDLLTHRSGLGLGEGDLIFVPRTDHSRADVVRALRWLKPKTSFRSNFAYDNLLYIVAGAVIERVSGQSWESFVHDRLLTPMGMSVTTTDEASRWLNPDRSQAHARLGPPMRGAGPESVLDEHKALGPNANPAGGIMSSAEDMSRWIAVQLAQGRLPDGKPLWSEAQAREMWSMVTPEPTPPPQGPLAEAAPQFRGYALGWSVQDYRGHRIVWHAGGTLGFLTLVVLLPEKDTGFVILQNSEDLDVLFPLEDILLDHYFGLPKKDWASAYRAVFGARRDAAVSTLARLKAPARRTQPSAPAQAYAGAYADPWYGDMTVKAAADKLVVDFTHTPGMTAELEPYTGDTFVARWRDGAIEPAYVTFTLTPEGAVSHVTLKALSPTADFSYDYQDLDFTPKR